MILCRYVFVYELIRQSYIYLICCDVFQILLGHMYALFSHSHRHCAHANIQGEMGCSDCVIIQLVDILNGERSGDERFRPPNMFQNLTPMFRRLLLYGGNSKHELVSMTAESVILLSPRVR